MLDVGCLFLNQEVEDRRFETDKSDNFRSGLDLINKMKERSDTTIPHSEIHIPHLITKNPFISVSPNAYL